MATRSSGRAGGRAAKGRAPVAAPKPGAQPVISARERFLPLTLAALIERLAAAGLWAPGEDAEARRLFRFLDFWRHQAYVARLMDLQQAYEPFNPDSESVITRTVSGEARIALQKSLIDQIRSLLTHANFTEVHPSQIEVLSRGSFYGLDLNLDLSVFDEAAVFYRGSGAHAHIRRNPRRLYLGKEAVEYPVFKRLCVVFKLKPFDVRVAEVMAQLKCERRKAERIVRKLRSTLPPGTSSDFVYMKLFKNIPHTDLEMVFPNARIKFKTTDKIAFGVTASSGLGMGVAGAATKLAIALTPFGMAGAAVVFGGAAARQVSNFVSKRNKYLMKMAQNLYFHAMADNSGVLTLLADRAAEEDVKEELLLYSVLAKQPANIRDLDEIDAAIERYLKTAFGIDANFDIDEALKRLLDDGIVQQLPDGTLDTLTPKSAAAHIDALWDAYLDNLPGTAPPPAKDAAQA